MQTELSENVFDSSHLCRSTVNSQNASHSVAGAVLCGFVCSRPAAPSHLSRRDVHRSCYFISLGAGVLFPLTTANTSHKKKPGKT